MKSKKASIPQLFSLLTFFIFYFSLFIVGCANPLIIQIAEPRIVTFESNGGSDVEKQTVYKGYPVKRPPNPVKKGCIFDAWYSDNETFNEIWNFNTVPSGDLTLYANWDLEIITIETRSVTFNKNGGDTDAQPFFITVDYGSRISPPATEPARDGYVFGGWYRDEDCLSEWIFDTDIVTADVTLYAKWTILPVDDGSAGLSISVEQIKEGAPLPDDIDNITLSRAAADGYPDKFDVKIDDITVYDTGSVKWEIFGAGNSADISVSNTASFTLDAADIRYNSLGGHTLRLSVAIDGVPYMVNINFTIAE